MVLVIYFPPPPQKQHPRLPNVSAGGRSPPRSGSGEGEGQAILGRGPRAPPPPPRAGGAGGGGGFRAAVFTEGRPASAIASSFSSYSMILQLAGEVIDVRLHVEVAVAAQVEQNGARLAFLLAAQRLVDRAAHRVVGFGRGHDAFGARRTRRPRKQRSGDRRVASISPSSLIWRHQRRHAVVAQAAGVEARAGVKVEPSVCILTSGVRWPVSPKS